MSANKKDLDVEKLVDRFLWWPLPKDFAPDCGITFKPVNHVNSWPVGTNLFTADQARGMFRHVMAGTMNPQAEVMAALKELLSLAETGDYDDTKNWHAAIEAAACAIAKYA